MKNIYNYYSLRVKIFIKNWYKHLRYLFNIKFDSTRNRVERAEKKLAKGEITTAKEYIDIINNNKWFGIF